MTFQAVFKFVVNIEFLYWRPTRLESHSVYRIPNHCFDQWLFKGAQTLLSQITQTISDRVSLCAYTETFSE